MLAQSTTFGRHCAQNHNPNLDLDQITIIFLKYVSYYNHKVKILSAGLNEFLQFSKATRFT